ICKGTPQHEEICLGLFTLVLTEPAQAQKCYRDLALVSRDGMNIVLNKINHILMEKYLKLQDTCRTQLVWLLRELVKSGVLGADGVCMTFMKQIAEHSGTAPSLPCPSPDPNLLLPAGRDARARSEPCPEPPAWWRTPCSSHPPARQLTGNSPPLFFFSQFMDCFMIGRDLVRLLQNVARIPEFEQLWKDILHNPQVLSSQFTGVLQLLQSRTSRKFLACRLTPDMETKLLFMTSRVIPEGAGGVSGNRDPARSCIPPIPPSPNRLLLAAELGEHSRDVPGSKQESRQERRPGQIRAFRALLPHSRNWEFPAPDGGGGFSTISRPLTPHLFIPDLFQIIPNFYPPLEAHVRQGVFNSLTHIVEKRVLAHLAPLFDNPKLDKELRAMLREKFPEFCSSPSPPIEVKIEEPVPMEMENHLEKDDGCYDNAEAAFSDDEEELN
ncbi:INT3 protein, partial [Corvus moneduloides]|nr:INT3 protein [Corvus moneduloides]